MIKTEYLYQKNNMKNILKQYLDKGEDFTIEDVKEQKEIKKIKPTNEIIEVVEKILITEDGRQILNG